MCIVSNVFNDYIDRWRPYVPSTTPGRPLGEPPFKFPEDYTKKINLEPPITDEEIREFRRLLEAARAEDKRTNAEPCEDAKKKEVLKEIAKALNINIDFIDEVTK